MSLCITYRGSLNSCNYSCNYCPFAKQSSKKAVLQQDEEQLNRFLDWVEQQTSLLRLLFTPWGEALIWPVYQRAITRLSKMPHVTSIAIQTNLSGKLSWLQKADASKIYLWSSFHPDQVSIDEFITKCEQARSYKANLSAGMVGLKQHFDTLQALRRHLPDDVYIWVNANKDEADYYSRTDIEFLTQIDPFFPLNLTDHLSFGKPCHTGNKAFTVDGNGDIRRCHFITNVIGNIYTQPHENALKSRTCTAQKCDCYLGYVHLEELQFEQKFGKFYFERYRNSTKHD